MDAFDTMLEKYGGNPAALRRFDAGGPEVLPYATLVSARDAGNPDLAALNSVYEWQDSPLIFLVDGELLNNDTEQLNRIRRLLAMRGDAPYLGVVLPGRLTLYHISLDKHKIDGSRINLAIPSSQERATFAYLGNTRPGLTDTDKGCWISDVVLRLLGASIDDLKTHFGVSNNDAVSMVGRALFTRFLGDRGLLPKSIGSGCFDTSQQASQTSDWLDHTFNGDFLPLSPGLFQELPPDAFRTLSDIMRRAPGGELYLGWEEKWDNLDFAHIPVGVLSQAYESYLKKHEPLTQRKEGGFYTPALIANLMVQGAFHALNRNNLAHKAKVLDPAVGAGVFLLTAFRQLVSARWRHDNKRPNTKTLREILYKQITGFDINESALRFAALGLYLISIELDPNPEPIAKLRFKKLRDRVLYNFRDNANGNTKSESICCLGSLGDKVGEEHNGCYDLVIGNPPWASRTGLSNWEVVKSTIAHTAQLRLHDENLKPPLPNEALDLPFVWRAMEWAKPNGQIAFALHARLLFQQNKTMPEARNALFRALNITSIINGTDLRQTKVWPEISAPFCLLFACNRTPQPGDGFRFISPRWESSLNKAGGFRIDVSNAEVVSNEQILQRPEHLKILYRGSQLDLEVYERLATQKLQTFKAYWAERFGSTGRRLKYAGNGYKLPRGTSKDVKSAAHLIGMPNLATDGFTSPVLETEKLPLFVQDYLHRPRDPEIYQSPLLIIPEVPKVDANRIQSSISEKNDVVYSQSYHGYSVHTHPNGNQLVRYLSLVIGSKIALWLALITSGRFGFEREVIEKFIVENTPILPFEELDEAQLDQIDPLFNRIAKQNDEQNWTYVDTWVASLYGLKRCDLQVISDTLNSNLPFSENKKAAETYPSTNQVKAFCKALEAELKPWAKHFESNIRVSPEYVPTISPWRAVYVSFQTAEKNNTAHTDWAEMIRVADQTAASEIFYSRPDNGELLIGRLNQARYWSNSQARLVARRIIWDHAEMFNGSPTA